jgi:fluoride ion exporter CrcB/FEX
MMPKTKLGKWAGGLSVVFLVLLIALILGVNLGILSPGIPLAITVGICTMIAGFATFVIGVVSLAKFKDRSFVVILAIVLGSIAITIFIFEAVEAIAA